MRLIVSMGLREGGRPTAPLRPWLVELDPETGATGRAFALPFEPSLASGPAADDEATRPVLLEQGVLLQPTHTRLFWFCPDAWRVIDDFSHPLFASVHSAAAVEGGFVVSCAANESVLRFGRGDALVDHHWLRPGRFASAYPGVDDFRVLHHDALKPHSHHPNCAFVAAGRQRATCFETRSCIDLDGGPPWELPGIPHDGSLQEGVCWFTLIDGRILALDPDSGTVIEAHDLRAMTGTEQVLGWCRGIAVVGRRAWVGMTQLRSTTHREVLRVLLRGERGHKRPSRVVEVDLDRRSIVREIEVGNAAGATIYGITPVPGQGPWQRPPRSPAPGPPGG